MLPIRKLLSRIRWDPRFRRGQFALGYYDRRERDVRTVALADLRFPPDRPQVFELWDEDGELHTIPLHRVRCVYRDGRVIWERRVSGDRLAGQELRRC